MKTDRESSLNRIVRHGVVSLIVVCMSLGSSGLMAAESSSSAPAESTTVLEEEKKVKVSSAADTGDKTVITEEPPFVVTDPAVTVESGEGIDGMTMLYIGGGAGLVALGALALAGGGGSSSDSNTVPEPTTPVVGPSIYGSNWVGFLDLKNTEAQGFQNVTAAVVQNGAAVQITTSSTLLYGRLFNGKISGSGYMKMYDAVTGEDWTTHRRNATANSIELLDYVNGLKDFDTLSLGR